MVNLNTAVSQQNGYLTFFWNFTLLVLRAEWLKIIDEQRHPFYLMEISTYWNSILTSTSFIIHLLKRYIIGPLGRMTQNYRWTMKYILPWKFQHIETSVLTRIFSLYILWNFTLLVLRAERIKL